MEQTTTLSNKRSGVILASHGGPRHPDEVEAFLRTLLCDQDLIRTGMPRFLHKRIFLKVAARRAPEVKERYRQVGGASPLFQYAEELAQKLRSLLDLPVLPFHRYLEWSHQSFIQEIRSHDVEEWKVFPLFPHFTYASTGSIARWCRENLPYSLANSMRWVKSYPTHHAFLDLIKQRIHEALHEAGVEENESVLLFTAHGMPRSFLAYGELYLDEVEHSFSLLKSAFPKATSKLAFQSKSGPGDWLRPYAKELCDTAEGWIGDRRFVLIIPLSFLGENLETLHELDRACLPALRTCGVEARRIRLIGDHPEWPQAIRNILAESNFCSTDMLIRRG